MYIVTNVSIVVPFDTMKNTIKKNENCKERLLRIQKNFSLKTFRSRNNIFMI